MKQHSFLFEPKNWLGEGKIELSSVEEVLDFYTRWKVGAIDPDGEVRAKQEVQIKGMAEIMDNHFVLKKITGSEFEMELENAALGTIAGKGVIKEDLIAWEFRQPELGFEGFEFYERQPDGSYLMRAEYATPDQYRTIIKGKIWKKKDPS